MVLCSKKIHKYLIRIICRGCGRDEEITLEFSCSVKTYGNTLRRIRCSKCRDLNTYGLLYFSCEQGDKDSWFDVSPQTPFFAIIKNIDD